MLIEVQLQFVDART